MAGHEIINEPLLTIGIPTLDRAKLLHRAIGSCLKNTIPVKILVADQGKTDETAKVMAHYRHHPHVTHLPTEATCLWENWKAAALACETPYFAWLQDDDVVSRGYAAQICTAFKTYPNSLHWQARCHIAIDERMAGWFSGNGPWVPMPMLEGDPIEWPGELLLASMFLCSWSLSPGVAFRCGKEFTEALESIPPRDDLFTERLILAEMGLRGPFVASPVIAGYWIHHGGNESYKQHEDQDRQLVIATEHLDGLLDRCPNWMDPFREWCLIIPAANIMAWLHAAEFKHSKHADEIKGVMEQALQGRVKPIQAPELVEA